MLPLLEAKMLHHYDTRWATYQPDGSTRGVTAMEKADDTFHVIPRYWVAETEVDRKLDGRWDNTWLLGWRRVARSTDERTFISAVMPKVAVGDSVFIMLSEKGRTLAALLSSLPLDFVARQKFGGTNASFFLVEQLPVPTPDRLSSLSVLFNRPVADWVGQRVDRLNARPTMNNVEARAAWRAELDALVCHLYGLDRDEVDYILETFPIVRRQDEAAHGEYRTRRLILAAYDEMQHAHTTSQTYISITVEAR